MSTKQSIAILSEYSAIKGILAIDSAIDRPNARTEFAKDCIDASGNRVF